MSLGRRPSRPRSASAAAASSAFNGEASNGFVVVIGESTKSLSMPVGAWPADGRCEVVDDCHFRSASIDAAAAAPKPAKPGDVDEATVGDMPPPKPSSVPKGVNVPLATARYARLDGTFPSLPPPRALVGEMIEEAPSMRSTSCNAPLLPTCLPPPADELPTATYLESPPLSRPCRSSAFLRLLLTTKKQKAMIPAIAIPIAAPITAMTVTAAVEIPPPC